MISNQQAIQDLQAQLSQIQTLKNSSDSSREFKEWRRNTKVLLKYIFPNTNQSEEFEKIEYFSQFEAFNLINGGSINSSDSAFCHGLIEAEAFLASCIEEVKKYRSDQPLAPEEAALHRIERICNNFPAVANEFLHRYGKRSPLKMKDEYDVQYLFRGLLRQYFNDIRPEEWTPSYAGGASRVDFLLPQEKIVIEIKKTRKNLNDKELGEELIIDIARYKTHPDCHYLIVFVYDPERKIKNAGGLENDLNKVHDSLPVKLIIKK